MSLLSRLRNAVGLAPTKTPPVETTVSHPPIPPIEPRPGTTPGAFGWQGVRPIRTNRIRCRRWAARSRAMIGGAR